MSHTFQHPVSFYNLPTGRHAATGRCTSCGKVHSLLLVARNYGIFYKEGDEPTEEEVDFMERVEIVMRRFESLQQS